MSFGASPENSLQRRIARAHPALLFAAFILSWCVGYLGLLSGIEAPHRTVFLAIPVGVMCLWCWSVFEVSREARPDVVGSRPAWLFALPPAATLIIGIAGWPTNNSPAAFAFFAILLCVLWIAAQALEKADADGGAPSAWGVLGVMLMLYITVFGVWGVAPRTRRVEARIAG